MAFDHNKARELFNTPELQQVYESILAQIDFEIRKSHALYDFAERKGENILKNNFKHTDVKTLMFMLSEAIYNCLDDQSLIIKFTQEESMHNMNKEDLFSVTIRNMAHGIGYVIDEKQHEEILGSIDDMYDDV